MVLPPPPDSRKVRKYLWLSANFGEDGLRHTRCCGCVIMPTEGGTDIGKQSWRTENVRDEPLQCVDDGVEPTGI